MRTGTKALVAGLAMVASGLVAGRWGSAIDGWWHLLALLQLPIVLGTGGIVIMRLRCPFCGRRLSRDFPPGSLPLLPFAVQPCKQCGKRI
jgi:hypothetical protein